MCGCGVYRDTTGICWITTANDRPNKRKTENTKMKQEREKRKRRRRNGKGRAEPDHPNLGIMKLKQENRSLENRIINKGKKAENVENETR